MDTTYPSKCEPPFDGDCDRHPIFEDQLAAAHRLARHFDHAWGALDPADFPRVCTYHAPTGEVLQLTTAATIHAETRNRQRRGWWRSSRKGPSAITSPTNVDGFLHHHAAGEPLRWTVWDDGMVWLWCYDTEGKCVLQAIVRGASDVFQLRGEDGSIREVPVAPVRLTTESAQAPYSARELALMEEALVALMSDPELVSEATQPLWTELAHDRFGRR